MVNFFRMFLERMLLLAVCFIIPSIACSLYLSGQRTGMATSVTRRYLDSVAASGVIDKDEYEQFLAELARVSGCTVELSYDVYSTEPYYEYYSADKIEEYYKKRNIRTKYPISSKQRDVSVVDIDKLFFQNKSNASVLAGLMGDMSLMGPLEGMGDSYTVVVPEQEVYVGEPLVTVLLQSKDGVTFYRIADTMFATGSGVYTVPVCVNGIPTGKSIRVTAWDKLVICEKGHTYPSTKEVISHYKATGKWELCPYCHAYVDDITLSGTVCDVPLGTMADSVPVSVRVAYMDGHEEDVPFVEVPNDYDPYYAGSQRIEVSFGGVTKEVGTITTVEPLCSQCGGKVKDRCYMDYIKETRCAECLEDIPIFLGETLSVTETVDHDRIVEVLLNEGKFKMYRGNYLMLSVYRPGQKRTLMDVNVFFLTGKEVQKSAG